ncbi:Uncharacterized protein FWK35_00018288 [Aphis craccivora]|uniref:DUF5679 domain-containing protein n=1 Tax=Aphis craccivora TaxID=307492 RepID=A0A6G0Z1S1_APHCR|nr:Uncharacterized protein FWK35_00018288 [Aphis craccivora]
MSDPYCLTYCVGCRQKTSWNGQPTLNQTRNFKAGLRGVCIKCNKTKFTFVTTVYYCSKR